MENENESKNYQENLVVIQTHLQISNLVQILQTINPRVLFALVEQSPEELTKTSHYKIMRGVAELYQTVMNAAAAQAQPAEEESAGQIEVIAPPSNIITPDRF